MSKVLYIILISVFSLSVISCGSSSDSGGGSSTTSTTDDDTTTNSPFYLFNTKPLVYIFYLSRSSLIFIDLPSFDESSAAKAILKISLPCSPVSLGGFPKSKQFM
jgi:hypothetical protein